MPTGRPNGRPPKPNEKQKTNSSTGVVASGLGELRGVTEVPKLPAGYPVELKKVWTFLWEEVGTLKDADRFVAMLFLDSWQDYLFLSKGIRSGTLPRVVTNPNGTVQSHPYWAQLKEVKVQLNTYLSSLGLTPADRARLFIDAELQEEDGKLASLLKRQPRDVLSGK